MKAYSVLAALAFGSALAQRIPADDNKVAARQWSGGGDDDCVWTGHCAGDSCRADKDCDGQLGCVSGKCAVVGAGGHTTTARTTARPTTVRTTVRTTRPATTSVAGCVWQGHCLGASCETGDDCDGELGCYNGKCANAASTLVPSTTVRPTSVRPTSGVITITVTRTVSSSSQPPTPTSTRSAGPGPSCGDSPLACIGASCRTDADCGFTLIICNDGICGL